MSEDAEAKGFWDGVNSKLKKEIGMIFRGKSIAEYKDSDIQSLIENKVPESKTLDYKRELKFDEKSKVEFIYDVSSFYNTEGGFMVIGLDEEKDEDGRNIGLPKMPDIAIIVQNYDGLLLKIQDVVRQSTNPAIANLFFSPLLTVSGSNVYIIGIPKARSLPAMVTYGNNNRFYKRKANGKYSLDTYELYETFNQINSIEKRIGEFIKERQYNVSENIFWPNIGSLSSIIMHVIPVDVYTSQIDNFSSYETENYLKSTLSPPGHDGYSTRYCLEGFHLFHNRRFNDDSEIVPYNLLFRNGSTETFTNEPFYKQLDGSVVVMGEEILEVMKDQLEKNLRLYKKFSIESNFYLSIRMNNLKCMNLYPSRLGRNGFNNFNELQLPITLMQTDSREIKIKLKSIMDILWQSVGENECPAIKFDKAFASFPKE